jgi:hypothetical protein
VFERYTEKARRVVFFARYEASEFGSPCIETEHVLLGLLREDSALTHRFLPSSRMVESIRREIEALATPREKISTSVDLPLSNESKRVFAYAAEEAALLNHKHIGTEHLLLGLLREEKCLAADLLRERGLWLRHVREELVRARSDDSPGSPPDRAKLLQLALVAYVDSLGQGLATVAIESRIYVRQDRQAGKSPFVCIEVLSPNERLRDLRNRIDDHLATGVGYVWLLDPLTRQVYTFTAEAGLQEFRGAILRTQNPNFELPLSEVFI